MVDRGVWAGTLKGTRYGPPHTDFAAALGKHFTRPFLRTLHSVSVELLITVGSTRR
jgi:hypothetical protein